MITLVFSGFSLILHLAHHTAKVKRSCCKTFAAEHTFKLKAHCAVSSTNWNRQLFVVRCWEAVDVNHKEYWTQDRTL